MTFEEYVTARGPGLVRLARLLCGDPHRAEDLVQDVLAKAYARWRKISGTERPDLYVRQMLVNQNRSWWRLGRNRELAVSEPAATATVAGAESGVVERDALWRMVLSLPQRQRAVLVLRFYEDLDDAAIAEILDVSPVTVRTHAMRALARLRELHAPELAPSTGGQQ
ncbi:SigE family RNA polymerase sigma factor [Longispora urticae]